MPILFSVLGLGFLLGLRHAIDADHVVAVAAITSQGGGVKKSSLVGILWGIGHSITVTLVAIPIIFFSLVIPARLGLGFEFCVGIVLVIVGALNILRIRKKSLPKISFQIHKHKHQNRIGVEHSHVHSHLFSSVENELHHLGFFYTFRPLVIGLAHGLAGSSAIALLILSTIKNPLEAVVYLFIFHMGVIIGMMLITTALGVSIAFAQARSQKIHNYLEIVSGVLSLIFGLYIMYETGVQQGLFSGEVVWNPH